MSALDLLPPSVRDRVSDPTTRFDLRLIPEAEAAGWIVSFRNDHWAHSAAFKRGDEKVWLTGKDVRAAVLIDDQYTPPSVFPFSEDGLRAALLLLLPVEGTEP